MISSKERFPLTRNSFPNISLPFSDIFTSETEASQPLSLLPTFAPIARPTIWCPKQTPITLTLPCARTLCVNSTSFTIQGSSAKESNPRARYQNSIDVVEFRIRLLMYTSQNEKSRPSSMKWSRVGLERLHCQ